MDTEFHLFPGFFTFYFLVNLVAFYSVLVKDFLTSVFWYLRGCSEQRVQYFCFCLFL